MSGKHVVFIFVDHFEPGKNIGRVSGWIDKYKSQVRRFVDTDGCHPLHTWFYPCEQLLPDDLLQLSDAAYEGYGEIELHLHHADDTSENLRNTLEIAVKEYARAGAFVPMWGAEPRFGFIHGNWALDNSREHGGINYCGVNDELRILSECGCYADFTFPGTEYRSLPAKLNSIYYAVDDPGRPKSYNWGKDACTWEKRTGDLMLVQGALSLDWGRKKWGMFPYVEDSDIASYNLPSASRARLWVNAGIHVRGCPEWIFVKVHTHGAHKVHMPAVLGDEMSEVYEYLVQQFTHHDNSLHFVTAREAFNIIKAAEDGKSGLPGQYRDYAIKKPLNRMLNCSCLYELVEHTGRKLFIKPEDEECRICFNYGKEIVLTGKIREFVIISNQCNIPSGLQISIDGTTLVINEESFGIDGSRNMVVDDLSISITTGCIH